MNSAIWRFGFCLVFGVATAFGAVELTGNLAVDGGFEDWITVKPDGTAGSWWNHLTGQKNCALSYDGQKNILMPKIMEQCGGCKVMQQESNDVHSGKYAIRLMEGLYIRVADLQARDGDVIVARFWAKGSGRVQFYPHGEGETKVETLDLTGKAEPDRWSLIEQRLLVACNGPARIAFRLVPFSEMLIDDLFVARVIRPGERQLAEVPADCQERIAFATPAGGAIALDGKLDEPAWGRAIAFGGFRSASDQALLAAVQPAFRVLFDEQNLYVGIEIPLPDADRRRADLKNRPLRDSKGAALPRNDVYTSRDSVEFFLQAPGRSGYHQLVVSLDGYRYDSVGEDRAWNGKWESAVSATGDRWFLEVKIPAQDLGMERTAPAEDWRLNLCVNQERGCLTWAAVGPAFHNPNGFGKLVTQEFATWRDEQPAVRARRKAEILQAAGANSARYAERLAAIENTADSVEGGGARGEVKNWQEITRAYAQTDYIGSAYRCVADEVRYRKFFE